MTSTAARATELLALHTSPKILTLVNVWDVASAKAVGPDGAFKSRGTGNGNRYSRRRFAYARAA